MRLTTEGRVAEAIVLLHRESREALAAGNPKDAAHFHTVRASLLMNIQQDGPALRALRAAVRLDPLDGRRHLAIARCHVLTGSSSPSALRHANRAIRLFSVDHDLHAELPHALGLRGVLLSRLGLAREAVATLKSALTALRSDRHIGEPDLWLVRECLSRRMAPAHARAYLKAAHSWAAARKDQDLLARIKALAGPLGPA